MESYQEFKKRANYGYQPQYTTYNVGQGYAYASNVPQGQQNWNVTRNANGQVTSFSNQAGLQRQQRMQQIAQTRQGGNITPQQYQQMVAQRQYQMQQAAYQWRMRQMQQQQMAQQQMMPQQTYGQRPQMAAPPPQQQQFQQNQHGSVTSTIGRNAQGIRTFSAHN